MRLYAGMKDSLYFSDHHLQVREMVREFARDVVKPGARQYDLESRFPWDNLKRMAELGLFGIPWPGALKQAYVPLLATGRVLGGFGLTEPGAGSDAGGTKTVAVERGDHYVLNGSKIFITHAGVGEIFVVTARTDPRAGKTRGITSFIVTKDTTDLDEARRVGVGHEPSLAKTPGVAAAK